jgi:hypothetical protein
VILIGTWLPIFTIIPFFYDTKSEKFITISSVLYSIYSYGTLVYNFYFTGQCLWIFHNITHRIVAIRKQDEAASKGEIERGGDNQSLKANRERLEEREFDSGTGTNDSFTSTRYHRPADNIVSGLRKIKIVAVKSIGHAITSSFAALYYTYGGQAGYDSWNLIIILGMHFWFNMSVERFNFLSVKERCSHHRSTICRLLLPCCCSLVQKRYLSRDYNSRDRFRIVAAAAAPTSDQILEAAAGDDDSGVAALRAQGSGGGVWLY